VVAAARRRSVGRTTTKISPPIKLSTDSISLSTARVVYVGAGGGKMITTTTTAAAKQQQQQRRASAAAVGEDATAAAEGSWSMLMGSPTKRSSYSPQAARGRDAAEEEEVVAPPPNWCGTQTDWPLARSFFVLRLTCNVPRVCPEPVWARKHHHGCSDSY
jgi:hypothetical protein